MEKPEGFESLSDDRKASWEAMTLSFRAAEHRLGSEDLSEWKENQA